MTFGILKEIVKSWGGKELSLSGKAFLAGIILGLAFSPILIANSGELNEFLEQLYAEFLAEDIFDNFASTASMIFQRNVTAAFITILLGLIYKYLSLIPIFLNAVILGLVSLALVVFSGQPSQLLLLIPHGIFEIPALLLAGAIGLRLSKFAGKAGFGGRVRALLASKESIALVIFLLLIAATIEAGLIYLGGN